MWGRESRQSRGYGRAWELLRKQVLTAEPLCRLCEREGRVTLATEVDHIQPKVKGGTDDPENLQPICAPHHRIKSATDAGRALRPAIGLDGFPLP